MVTDQNIGNRSTSSAAEARIPLEFPVYLIFGADEYRVSERGRALVHALCPESEQALGLETIDGRADNQDEAVGAIARCLDALDTVGLFGGGKTVWMRDVTFLAPGVTGAAVKEAVGRLTERIRKGMGKDVRLVIQADALDKRSALYKACQGEGYVEEHAMPQRAAEADDSARERVQAMLRKADMRISPDALEQLIQKTGPDTRTIRSEVDKLILYAGDRKTLEAEDVRDVVSPSRESPAWDLNEALGRRRLKQALIILRRLLYQREPPIGLIIGMAHHFQILLMLKNCRERGWLSVEGTHRFSKAVWRGGAEVDRYCETFSRDPRKMHPYRTLMLLEQAAHFSSKNLMENLDEIVRTHEMMVRSAIPQELLLEMLVVRIAGPKQNRRKP